jgi:transcriptional regulator of acetoin/glycerol metabolism
MEQAVPKRWRVSQFFSFVNDSTDVQLATPTTRTDDLKMERDVGTALIHKAVTETHGDMVQAARAPGISRATVCRRLGRHR